MCVCVCMRERERELACSGACEPDARTRHILHQPLEAHAPARGRHASELAQLKVPVQPLVHSSTGVHHARSYHGSSKDVVPAPPGSHHQSQRVPENTVAVGGTFVAQPRVQGTFACLPLQTIGSLRGPASANCRVAVHGGRIPDRTLQASTMLTSRCGTPLPRSAHTHVPEFPGTTTNQLPLATQGHTAR